MIFIVDHRLKPKSRALNGAQMIFDFYLQKNWIAIWSDKIGKIKEIEFACLQKTKFQTVLKSGLK